MLVVDFTWYLPGPFASRELLRLGARVVHVEPPQGDPMRPTAPAWHDAVNAGKESVVCDLKTEAGLALANALCARADAVLDGFRPGVLDRLGVVVPETAVLCAVTGFGGGNRHELRAGHDVNYLGWAGVLADTAPAMPPTQIADLAAGGLSAALEVTAALLARERTGQGARIVVSMTHGSHRLVAHRLEGLPERLLTGGAACYRIYPTADGRWLTVGALEPKFWQRLCELVGAAGAGGAPVRPGPGSGRGRARRGDRRAPARRVARALRRRGRLRRPGLDDRGGRRRVRLRARSAPAPALGEHTEAWRSARA